MKQKAFHPKKRLGQNFLYDPAIARRIVEAADLSPDQVVVELGCGKGILTKPLSEKRVRLIAIEVDRDLYTDLAAYFETLEPREQAVGVELLNTDFTKLSITGLLTSRGFERCVLFGNIPYYLTREVLFSFLVDEFEMIGAAYLMVQREVGERIVSPPGSRVYGITSVILQTLYDVRSLFRVAAGSFFPKPKVGSMVLEFKQLDDLPIEPGELKGLLSLVKNLFQQRRKTIHNTIKKFYALSEPELTEIQNTAGVELNRRPEELGKEQFIELSRAVAEVTAA
ncbi:MAG: ribosomal RNA small subunit methyltransferase A [Candidatus Latescibacterota bacterium]|nr:MAG: ribosomal RNA small subunit methyltransferase A [Candidatus Latescibacterota bacterium]